MNTAQRGNLSEADILKEMQEQTLHALLRDTASNLVDEAATGPGLKDVASSPVVPSAAAGQVHLPDLLALDGTAFIETAFNAILHRPSDPKALTLYGSQVATGERSKIEILGKLRYSPEGRKVGVRIPGLLSRYIVVRSSRLRGIGAWIGFLVRITRLPRQVQRLQLELLNGNALLRSTIDNLQGVVTNIEWRVARLQADIRLQAQERLQAPGAVREIDAHPLEINTRLREIDVRLDELSMHSWAEPLIALGAQMDEQTRRTRLLELQAGDITTVAAVLRGLRNEHSWPDEDAPEFAARLTAVSRDVVRRAAQAEEVAEHNRAELLDQSRRLGLLLADVRRRLDQPFTPAEAARLEAADNHRLDPLYVAFEDRFRGSRSDIRERQRAHLPLLREAQAGSAERPIVDVGAGRGEWLELLREEGLQAIGVDLNGSMVEICRNLGLDCVEDDALSYLCELADNSLGAITGFHIIEHLPFKTFVALLDESRRVLKPDGLILFETPNPANLLVGSRWFYLDPTHRNPMPGEMTAMMAEARGFVQVQIRELHPVGARFQGRDEVLAAQLDRMFYGPQDYALVARKP